MNFIYCQTSLVLHDTKNTSKEDYFKAVKIRFYLLTLQCLKTIIKNRNGQHLSQWSTSTSICASIVMHAASFAKYGFHDFFS